MPGAHSRGALRSALVAALVRVAVATTIPTTQFGTQFGPSLHNQTVFPTNADGAPVYRLSEPGGGEVLHATLIYVYGVEFTCPIAVSAKLKLQKVLTSTFWEMGDTRSGSLPTDVRSAPPVGAHQIEHTEVSFGCRSIKRLPEGGLPKSALDVHSIASEHPVILFTLVCKLPSAIPSLGCGAVLLMAWCRGRARARVCVCVCAGMCTETGFAWFVWGARVFPLPPPPHTHTHTHPPPSSYV